MASCQLKQGGKGTVHHSSKILAAANNGDVENLRIIVQDALNRGHADKQNLYAALQRATRRGHIECASYLLDLGVKPDQPGDNGPSALHRAIDSELSELVLLLLRHGADIEKRDSSGRTPLMSAALQCRNKIVKILLEHGADIGTTSHNGRSVLLYLAASQKSSEILPSTFRLFFDTGLIDLSQRDPVGKNVLMWAVVRRNLALAKLAIDACGPVRVEPLIHAVDHRGRSALHMAVEDTSPAVRSMVSLLLSSGADVEGTSERSLTPLAIASARGNYEAVDVLLIKGANSNSTVNGDYDAADFVPRIGLNINPLAAAGMTPLHWAARNGHLKVVTRLLACKGIQANLKDDMFRSPLMQALESGHIEIVTAIYRHLCKTALSDKQVRVCKEIMGTIVDVKLKPESRNHTFLYKQSIYETVYENSPNGETLTTTRSAHLKARPDFRWIHLPANNVAWAEMLITKYFLEAGAQNARGLQACIRALYSQHREGSKVHSRHMEPLCELFERVVEKRTSLVHKDPSSSQNDTGSETKKALSEGAKIQTEMSNVMLFVSSKTRNAHSSLMES
jgi:ankyrin repeat protein